MTDDRYPVYPKAEFMDATEQLLDELPEDPAAVGADTVAALDRWFGEPAVQAVAARSGIALPDPLACLPEQGRHFWPLGAIPPHAFQRCACGARRYGELR